MVGVKDSKDAANKLIDFWTVYTGYKPQIDSYMTRWLKDFYISHSTELGEPFESFISRYPIPYKTPAALIKEARAGIWSIDFVEAGSDSDSVLRSPAIRCCYSVYGNAICSRSAADRPLCRRGGCL